VQWEFCSIKHKKGNKLSRQRLLHHLADDAAFGAETGGLQFGLIKH
jgi:hypothetical protein